MVGGRLKVDPTVVIVFLISSSIRAHKLKTVLLMQVVLLWLDCYDVTLGLGLGIIDQFTYRESRYPSYPKCGHLLMGHINRPHFSHLPTLFS